MKTILRVMFSCLVMLLTSCVSYNAYITHINKRIACNRACQQRLTVCNKQCDNSCFNCCLIANQRAARDYERYKDQQRIQGSVIIRQLNAYRDPLQCRKTTCECVTDYRTCRQTCTGKNPKQLQVAPDC